MQTIPLDEKLFQGHVSLEYGPGWVQPWRLPYRDLALFPPHAFDGRAAMPAGVRLQIVSNTPVVEVGFEPLPIARQFDCVIDNQLWGTCTANVGDDKVTFVDLPAINKRIEIYLSQSAPVRLCRLAIAPDATYHCVEDTRPRWIVYGSSITQCKHAASPAQTWPALVARQLDLHLTCLGFGSNCHLDPEVARLIRGLPADTISMCVGTNICGMASLSPRTFMPALIGFIRCIREGHPETPLTVMSPIINPAREVAKNVVGFNLPDIRQEILTVVEMLRSRCDYNLYYLDGLQVLGPNEIHLLEYGAHPGPDGYRHMAEVFARLWPGAPVR
jgi:hypothetical protein